MSRVAFYVGLAVFIAGLVVWIVRPIRSQGRNVIKALGMEFSRYARVRGNGVGNSTDGSEPKISRVSFSGACKDSGLHWRTRRKLSRRSRRLFRV